MFETCVAMDPQKGFGVAINESVKCISSFNRIINFFEGVEQQYIPEKAVKLSFFLLLLHFLFVVVLNRNNHKKKQSATKAVSVPQARHFSVWLPFVDGLYTLYKLQGGVQQLEEWFAKFGKIFELPFGTKSVVFVAEPRAVQKILMSTSPQHLSKPEYIYDRIFVDAMKGGSVNSEYTFWTRHRKMVSTAFSYKSLQAWFPHLDKCSIELSNALVKKNLEGNIQQVESDDLWDLLHLYSVRNVCHFVTGSPEVYSDDSYKKYYKDFHRYKSLVLKRLWNPQLHFKPYWYFHPLRNEYEELQKSFDDGVYQGIQHYISKEITSKQESHTPNKNHANQQLRQPNKTKELKMSKSDEPSFLCLIEWMLKNNATEKEIHTEVSTFVAAGYETVAIAIQMLLLHLALNPNEQTRCREEVDSIFASKSNMSSSKTEQNMDINDLSALKHLERCIQEALRLTAVVPAFFRRIDSSLLLDNNVELPGGTIVAVVPWVLHRDPDIFPNPMKFDSGRFTAENSRKRHPYSYIPFSGGPRNCIGYKVAMMQMKVMAARIIRHFVVRTTDKIDSVKHFYEATLRPERNYNITLHQQ